LSYYTAAPINLEHTLKERLPQLPRGHGSNPSKVKSKTEKLAPVASLINVHQFRSRAGLYGWSSVRL